MKKMALVLGGAGFIGSQIASQLYTAGYRVTIIDGLFSRTGGRLQNIRSLRGMVDFLPMPIRSVTNLSHLIDQSDVIIDCMAWTRHRAALADPLYDLQLNVESHLDFIQSVPTNASAQIFFLGSRGQYGNPLTDTITEETPQLPEDAQGIHKVTAESHYRLYAKLKNLNVVSLRLANCFGENQPVSGEDIGLVGGFIRDVLAHRAIDIYGEHRQRNLLYVKDVAEIVLRLSRVPAAGFQPFNVAGCPVSIESLVKTLIELADGGSYQIKELPDEIRITDPGNADFSDAKLHQKIGPFQLTDLRVALAATVAYFREELACELERNQ